MKKNLFLLLAVLAGGFCRAQDDDKADLNNQLEKLRQDMNELKNNAAQSDKAKYSKTCKFVLNGIEIIKEIDQGTVEIDGARKKNILYNKLIAINNPSSDALGFQLADVIDKSLELNLASLPLGDPDKKRLRGQVSNLVEGVKKIFPPFQILSSAVSMISSFPVFQTRLEKVGRKADSVITDITYPITKEILGKFNGQLEPYMHFYDELNKANSIFENALYQHVVEYRDFIEEVAALKSTIERNINLNESIGEQINTIFDLENSSKPDFNHKEKNEDTLIVKLASYCMNVYDLVGRFKKFGNDFFVIQDDFYSKNKKILEDAAIRLPFKDKAKIDALIADLSQIKDGNANDNSTGDKGYKQRMKSISTKLNKLNSTRL